MITTITSKYIGRPHHSPNQTDSTPLRTPPPVPPAPDPDEDLVEMRPPPRDCVTVTNIVKGFPNFIKTSQLGSDHTELDFVRVGLPFLRTQYNNRMLNDFKCKI